MRLIIKNNYNECAKWTADYIAGKIKAAAPTKEKPFVLSLHSIVRFRKELTLSRGSLKTMKD